MMTMTFGRAVDVGAMGCSPLRDAAQPDAATSPNKDVASNLKSPMSSSTYLPIGR
jgi:hypothetical protein